MPRWFIEWLLYMVRETVGQQLFYEHRGVQYALQGMGFGPSLAHTSWSITEKRACRYFKVEHDCPIKT